MYIACTVFYCVQFLSRFVMILKSLKLQFTVNNILNALYYSPGPRTADGDYINNYNGFVPYVPQENRNYRLSLIFII